MIEDDDVGFTVGTPDFMEPEARRLSEAELEVTARRHEGWSEWIEELLRARRRS